MGGPESSLIGGALRIGEEALSSVPGSGVSKALRKAVEEYGKTVDLPTNYENVFPVIKDIQVGDVVNVRGSVGLIIEIREKELVITWTRGNEMIEKVIGLNGCDENGLMMLPLTGKDWRTGRGLRKGDVCKFENELESISEVGLLYGYDIEVGKFIMGYPLGS